MNTSTRDVRIAVHNVRTHLEQCVWQAQRHGVKGEPRKDQRNFASRALFICALAETEEEILELHRLVRLAACIYSRSSDVLHGRMSGLAIRPQEVAEWERVVELLEAYTRRVQPASSSERPGA